MPLTPDWPRLPALFPSLLNPEEWLPRLQRHWSLITAAAPRVQVTSVSAEDAVMRHYAESLELLLVLERHQPLISLVDVGSGGGFPGLVIAMLRPDLRIDLVEPLQKRARLLSELAGELALANVRVHGQRAEEAARGPLRDSAAAVTARAVAALPVLLEYVTPFASVGGLLVLPKGSAFEDELTASTTAIVELALEYAGVEPMRPEVAPQVRIALFRKVAQTPAKYPRRPGVAAKRPL